MPERSQEGRLTMRRSMKLVAVALLILVVGVPACASAPKSSGPRPTGESPTPRASSSGGQAASNLARRCDGPSLEHEGTAARGSEELRNGSGRVPATANIFGAGRKAPPSPGGGGAGTMPPFVVLPAGESIVLTFPRVEGSVNPIISYPDWNGPEGDKTGPTDVQSFQGISGITHRTNGMFLAGVFLTDAPASNPSPPRLDFSAFETADTEHWVGQDFGELAPEIGQTFLIGDGKGRSYVVPAEATRLFMGFADAYLYEGCPGWYGNNSGHLTVRVKVSEA